MEQAHVPLASLECKASGQAHAGIVYNRSQHSADENSVEHTRAANGGDRRTASLNPAQVHEWGACESLAIDFGRDGGHTVSAASGQLRPTRMNADLLDLAAGEESLRRHADV